MRGTLRRLPDLLDVLKAVALALFLSIGLNLFVLQVVDVRQSAREATVIEGDRLLLSKVDYRVHAPERGGVIVFRPPPPACPADASDCVPYVKRVVALEGDRVDLRDGRVYVNGAAVDEPYARQPTQAEGNAVTYPLVVPGAAVFVMGDNRPVSGDSRAWGAVPLSSIVGKAYLDFWPLDHARWLIR